MNRTEIQELISLVTGNLLNAYDDVDEKRKERFLSLCRKLAKTIANALGLPKTAYDIRTNRAGIAVSGEVTLHSDTLYVSLGQVFMSDRFMYRSCMGKTDYTGGTNQWMKWSDLLDFDRAVERFRKTANLVAV